MVYNTTQDMYIAEWSSLIEIYGEEYSDILEYLLNEWMRFYFEADLLDYKINKYLHFGIITISSGEGGHHALKKALKTERLDLYTAFIRIIAKLDD